MPAKSLLRLRLSHFLLLCAGLGLVLGLVGRSYLLKVQQRQLLANLNGYRVESYWEKSPLQRERLVYLVAFAYGPIASGDNPGEAEGRFSREYSGLYLDGKQHSSPDKRGWVYSNYEGRWGKLIPVPSDVLKDFTYLDFERLDHSDLWRMQFKPLLDKESATFAKMHKEAPDPTAFWNRGGHK